MRICFINQYFSPDRAATGQLLGQLVQDLASSHQISVICGSPTYAPEAVTGHLAAVEIHRVPLLPSSRSELPIRLLNYLLFLLGALAHALTVPKPDLVVCWTDPPLAGWAGLLVKAFRRVRYVQVFQDVYPDAAEAAGRMNDPISRFVLRRTTEQILKKADRLVAIGEDMKRLLEKKGADRAIVHVIENWADLHALVSTDGRRFRQENGLAQDDFVVMHSGNVGYSQDFGPSLDAAEKLRNEKNLKFVLIGDGAEREGIQKEAESRNLQNIYFLPFQPAETLAESLSAADIHYVSLKASFIGAVVPSKTYAILAVAKPIPANLPRSCDTRMLLEQAGCAIFADPTGESVAKAILQARSLGDPLRAMGHSGRRWVEAHAQRDQRVQRYQDLFAEVQR